jgi:hypothetical protein
MFMLPNWTFKIVLLMISPAARDGLTDLLDDLEFFLELPKNRSRSGARLSENWWQAWKP